MASDISPTTSEIYYSQGWQAIQDVLRVLDLGEGKMSKVQQPMVNRYQEMVDRQVDAILQEVYQTPLRAMNQVQPSGLTKRVFPGDVTWAAKYWTCGEILLAEFQQLEQNMTDQAKEFVDEAKKTVYAMTRPDHRVPGQRRKSNVSRTMPPNLQPPQFPEPPQ
jgi:hypothetical protein